MMTNVLAFWRLVLSFWCLVREDAVCPREFEPLLPLPYVWGARFLRIFAGPQAKKGRPGQRLARVFEKLGPTTIKLGQLLSTRADILGEDMAKDLGHLKDKIPPFPKDMAIKIIAQNLGKPVEVLFSEFGEVIGSASLAQAHRAILKDGRIVAVKILRPGIEARVASDIAAMSLAAGMVAYFFPSLRRLEPQAFVKTVSRSMTIELDLRLEAAAASEMADIMAKDNYMSAPKVIWEGVSKRVLILEWISATPLSDPDALKIKGLECKALANNIIRGFLAQALDHGLFHADLHEGNLFISPPCNITAVDFGIVGRLGVAERRFLAEILWGFIQRDYARIAKVHFEAGYVPASQNIDDFAQALRAVGEPVVGLRSGDVSMGRLLGQLFEITALFDMHLRPELVLLQKTMVTVEGVARRIDPDNDIWEAARPIVDRWIRRELHPKARLERFFERGLSLMEQLARKIEAPTPVVEVSKSDSHLDHLWLLSGLAIALSIGALVLVFAIRR